MPMLLLLYLEFFKVGLFAVGGGLATLPFLYDLADKYTWLTNAMIGDMIAISESTPGAMGVNMATYVGFQNSGIIGCIVLCTKQSDKTLVSTLQVLVRNKPSQEPCDNTGKQ